jgi:hypothetical protein
MKRLCVLIPMLFIIMGCETTLTLSRESPQRDFARASAICHSGRNTLALHADGLVIARSVQFDSDSVHWILCDGTCGRAPLSEVDRVDNIDFDRGRKEGRWFGFFLGLMAGGCAVGIGGSDVGQWHLAPLVVVGLSAFVVGPMGGANEGGQRGSHARIEVDPARPGR